MSTPTDRPGKGGARDGAGRPNQGGRARPCRVMVSFTPEELAEATRRHPDRPLSEVMRALALGVAHKQG